MGRVKELFMEIYDEKMDELIASGMDPQDADEIASKRADEGLIDRLADMADRLRQEQKDNQF